MKKPFFQSGFWQIAKPILIKLAAGWVKAKAPFVKTEQDRRNVDDGADVLRKM